MLRLLRKEYFYISKPLVISSGFGVLQQSLPKDKYAAIALVSPGFYIPEILIKQKNLFLFSLTPELKYSENPINVDEYDLIATYEALTALSFCRQPSDAVEVRLMEFLDYLVHFAEKRKLKSLPFTLIHEDMALFTGSTRVTITRLLAKFVEEGIVAKEGRQYFYKGIGF